MKFELDVIPNETSRSTNGSKHYVASYLRHTSVTLRANMLPTFQY